MNQVRLSDWKKVPPAILNLIILNTLIFFAQQIFNGDDNNFDITNTLALHYFKNPDFKFWQLFTHWFCHANFPHLIGNMVMLWLFGSKMENLMGAKKFLIIYFISGLGATCLHLGLLHFEYTQIAEAVKDFNYWPTQPAFHKFYLQHLNSEVFNNNYLEINKLDESWLNNPYDTQFIEQAKEVVNFTLERAKTGITLGASGAVCGIMAAYGYLFPNDRFYGYLPFPIKYVLPIILFAEIYYGAFYSNGSNVAHFAHAGGIVFGFVAAWIINKIYKKDFY